MCACKHMSGLRPFLGSSPVDALTILGFSAPLCVDIRDACTSGYCRQPCTQDPGYVNLGNACFQRLALVHSMRASQSGFFFLSTVPLCYPLWTNRLFLSTAGPLLHAGSMLGLSRLQGRHFLGSFQILAIRNQVVINNCT